ncbi:hypothetical protein [Actinocorallia populi]|uniref:hypothetical protein n=1 Tax=Actinocorallia populi TaxID=2079200 RepID=UPI001300506C|nr:hypothetical protein [Actinocorallia populi]
MPATPARLLPAAALAAGAVLALSAPASAKACVTDDWKLTRYRMAAAGQDVRISAKGGEGTRLSITKKTLSYDFTKAREVVAEGNDNGDEYTLTSVYKKKLHFKSSLKGGRKGTLSIKRGSATGDATVKSLFNTISLRTVKLARHYRNGNVDPLVPARPAFACSGRTLKLTAVLSDPAAPATVTATYRRI